MWELDCEESWVPKNWCFWTVMLEKTLESPLDCKEIRPMHPKADQSCVFIERTDAKAETPILWPPLAKSWLIGKDPDAGRDWGKEEKGITKDEMAGWHHRLDGHEFEWTLGVGDGRWGMACCDSWGHKKSDTTELLNWTELFMGFSRQEYWNGLPFPSPVNHILSDLSTMTLWAWLSFIELDKAVVLVWLDWLVFCEYGCEYGFSVLLRHWHPHASY